MKRYMNKLSEVWRESSSQCLASENESIVVFSDLSLHVNGNEVTVQPEDLALNISLATFLRETLGLTGTKISCNQGGCGACTVVVSKSPGIPEKSINACLTPLAICNGWSVVTIEGLGSQKKGLHPIQKALNDHSGTQCGFCSPGMIMSCYGLQANGKLRKDQIEHGLDSNICRCTGYRPILDAFKSLSDNNSLHCLQRTKDIEDLMTTKPVLGPIKQFTRDSSSVQWLQPSKLNDLMQILRDLPKSSQYQLVGGNTGKGVYDDGPYDYYIDVSKVKELAEFSSERLIFGGAVSISQLIDALSRRSDLIYSKEMMEHLSDVANTNVRNSGTIGGNLMIKHDHPEFPSDIFLLLEAIGSKITIQETLKTSFQCSPMEFLKMSMNRKVILRFELPNLTQSGYVFRSFKVKQRKQNSHALVNAAFLFQLRDHAVIGNPRMAFGGISDTFVRAFQTEKLLGSGKSLTDRAYVKHLLSTLDSECRPEGKESKLSLKYRKQLALSLFYKTILGILADATDPKLKSGSCGLIRDISTGKQNFQTDPDLFPINEALPKIEGIVQCTGEAKYLNDTPLIGDELHAAFVLSTEANCEIDQVNPRPALDIPGVVEYIDFKDIPGINNSTRSKSNVQEILSSGKISYHGQAIGLIVAENQEIAIFAARKVSITYKNIKKPVVSLKQALDKGDQWIKSGNRIDISCLDQRSNSDIASIEGEFNIGYQYHFHLETQSCLVRPIEDGQFDVISSTQWMDKVQLVIAQALNISNNKINITVRRLGGAFGGKISRSNQIAAACAVAANKLNKPVRLVMDIRSNMEMIGKRLPYHAKYHVDLDVNTLKLKSVDVHLTCDTGYSPLESTTDDAVIFTQNCYNSPKWNIAPGLVTTNTPANTYVRSPGRTQGHAIIENVMEHLAATLDVDPMELRLANMLQNGDKLVGGGTFEGENPLPELMRQLMEDCDFKSRKESIGKFNQQNRWKKKGISVVPVKYVHVIPTTRFYSQIAVYHSDGTVSVSHGGIEMGQGINTKVAQVVAKSLGIDMDMISVKPADNFVSPNTTSTDGSTGTESVCSATKIACDELLKRMNPIKERMDSPSWTELVHKCYRSNIDLTSTYMGCSENDHYPNYDIWGAIATEVEVDILTGEINIKRSDLIEDTGISTNPAVDIGQVEGGYIMSIGLWTCEEIKYDPKSGKLLNYDTWDYKPPSSLDIPEDLRVSFYDSKRNPKIFLGAKATGEPSVLLGVSVLFAIRQALVSFRKDIGIPPTTWFQLDGPASPEKISLASSVTISDLII